MSELGSLESYLNKRLLGQGSAIREFASAIESAENGPRRPSRTRAFLLLLGPTGTGKTEMVKLTASWLYGERSAQCLQRFDMGEYQHRDSILRLLGGPGQAALLGSAIDRLTAQGGGILLLDEIEKAHPDLLTALLSFDDARSTMADGSTKDLSSCYVIMTSNLGAAEASQMASSGYSAIRRKVLREAEQAMRKETLARFTASIVMDLLSFEAQEGIARSLLEREILLQSAHWQRRIVVADPRLLGWLVGRGFSPDMGARNLRRTVERHIGDALRIHAQSAAGQLNPVEAARIGSLSSDGIRLHIEGDAVTARAFGRSEALRALLARKASLGAPASSKACDPAGEKVFVEPLDFSALRPQLMEHYLSVHREALAWPAQKLKGLRFWTECVWGLARFGSGSWHLVGEHGEGDPSSPLPDTAVEIGFCSGLAPVEGEPGSFDPRPFCRVRLDMRGLRLMGALGSLALDEFLCPQDPVSEEACMRWRRALASA